MLQINANLNACFLRPSANAINNISGGTGKKDASENDKINRAGTP